MKHIPTEQPNIVIDPSTGAVLNTDIGEYQRIKQARADKRKSADLQDRITRLEQEVYDLKRMIDEIVIRNG